MAKEYQVVQEGTDLRVGTELDYEDVPFTERTGAVSKLYLRMRPLSGIP